MPNRLIFIGRFMSLKQSLSKHIWNLRFLNKKLKLNWAYLKFSFVKKILPKRHTPVDFSHVKKILIVRNDKHGDMIATTGFIKALAQAGYEVYVSSEKASLDIIEFNPYVKGVFSYQDKTLKALYRSIKNIREMNFDAVIDLKYCRGVYKKNIIFCAFVKSPILIGFNKSNIPAYNVSLPYYELSAHVTTRLPPLLKLFNIEEYDLNYEIYTTPEMQENTAQFIEKNLKDDQKLAIVNPLGGNKSRWLTQQQLDSTLKLLMPNYQVVMIGQPSQLQNLSWPDSIPLFQSKSILEVVPLIERADLILTVDTSIVHMASAFSKKTIALYLDLTHGKASNPFRAEYNAKVTKYGTHLLNLLSDAPYINTQHPDETPPINHLNWSPNNPNADQLIFTYRSFSDIPLAEFESAIQQALEE